MYLKFKIKKEIENKWLGRPNDRENSNWSKEPNLSFRKDSVYNLIVMDVRHHKIVQQLGSRYNLY